MIHIRAYYPNLLRIFVPHILMSKPRPVNFYITVNTQPYQNSRKSFFKTYKAINFQLFSVFQEMWAQNVFLIELETSWWKSSSRCTSRFLLRSNCEYLKTTINQINRMIRLLYNPLNLVCMNLNYFWNSASVFGITSWWKLSETLFWRTFINQNWGHICN